MGHIIGTMLGGFNKGCIIWESECLSDWNVVEGTINPEQSEGIINMRIYV